MLGKFNYRKGLWRLWLVAAVTWFVTAFALNAYGISYWVGYHYALLGGHDSVSSAFAEKEKVRNIVEVCQAAERRTCPPFPSASNRSLLRDYDSLVAQDEAQRQACVESQAFLDVLVQQSNARGIPDASQTRTAAPCMYMSKLGIPDVNWALLAWILIVPLIPLILYYLTAWVARGFAKHA